MSNMIFPGFILRAINNDPVIRDAVESLFQLTIVGGNRSRFWVPQPSKL